MASNLRISACLPAYVDIVFLCGGKKISFLHGGEKEKVLVK